MDSGGLERGNWWSGGWTGREKLVIWREEEIKRDVKGKKLEGYFGIIQNKCLFRCLFKITKTP